MRLEIILALSSCVVGTLFSGCRTVPVSSSEQSIQEQTFREIQESHIKGHVPPEDAFQRYLVRDIREYLQRTESSDFAVGFELLREETTQVGVGYPKFYVWIKANGTNAFSIEGAMRVAAIEKKRFEVTTFLKKNAIVANPKIIEGVFPQALLEKIRSKAGLKTEQ